MPRHTYLSSSHRCFTSYVCPLDQGSEKERRLFDWSHDSVVALHVYCIVKARYLLYIYGITYALRYESRVDSSKSLLQKLKLMGTITGQFGRMRWWKAGCRTNKITIGAK